MRARFRTGFGDSATELLRAIAEERPDLALLGNGRKDALDRLMLGSVATRVVREAPGPVGVIRAPALAAPDVPLAGRTLVVGIDFSPESGAALETAAELAKSLRASLRLVHVVSGDRLPEERELERRRTRLEDLANELNARGLPASTTVVFGQPGPSLVSESEGDPASFIVVGTRRRSRTARWLLGSVAEEVLHEARCGVVVAHRDFDGHLARARGAARAARRRSLRPRRNR